MPYFICVLHSCSIKKVCNFLDDDISSLIGSIANILSHFGPILEIYWSKQNSKQYSMGNLYLIRRRQLLPETGLNHGN